MRVQQIGDITVQRIVEHEIPVYRPTDMFDEATPEALAPYRQWLEPDALCPETGCLIMPVVSYLVRTRHHLILIDTCGTNGGWQTSGQQAHNRRTLISSSAPICIPTIVAGIPTSLTVAGCPLSQMRSMFSHAKNMKQMKQRRPSATSIFSTTCYR